MGKVSKTSLSPLLEAVSTLTIQCSIEASVRDRNQGVVRTALCELGNGLLAAESPDMVDAVVFAVLPALIPSTPSASINWDRLGTFENEMDILVFFANRAAKTMCLARGSDGPLQTSDSETSHANNNLVHRGPPTFHVGILAEAVNALQVCNILLSRNPLRRRTHVDKTAVASIAYASFRIRASCEYLLSDGGRTRALSDLILSDGIIVSNALIDQLPFICKGSASLGETIALVWNPPNKQGLHRFLGSLLKAEDGIFDFDLKAIRIGLVPCSAVFRNLALSIEREEHINDNLSSILAIALPMVGDVNVDRRLDALTVISHCIDHCSRDHLRFHSHAMLSALSQSLIWDDSGTTRAAFPVLAKIMPLAVQESKSFSDAPKVWVDVLQEVIRNFVAHVNYRGYADDHRYQADKDDHLKTAAAVAVLIPVMARSRLILHLEIIFETLQVLLCRTAALARNDGPSMLFPFEEAKDAAIETIRYSWPRVASHFEKIVQGCCGAVLSVRSCDSVEVSDAVMSGAVNILVWTSRCGCRSELDKQLRVVKEHGLKYPSLRILGTLCTRFEELSPRVDCKGCTNGNHGYGIMSERLFKCIEAQHAEES